MKYLDQAPQRERRELWFELTRRRIDEVINPDGTGKIPQFKAPWREPVWILGALYSSTRKHIDLANLIVENYGINTGSQHGGIDVSKHMDFDIFISNAFSQFLYLFGNKLTHGARAVMEFHARNACRTFCGSRQPDYKFQGANDNMPMMGTYGLYFAGEALGIPEAIDYACWNLQEVRRILSRSAWMSEFNSCGYSAITLSGASRLATHARNEEVRKLALDIEHRIWAELVLHFHPSTYLQAGPHSRAYAIDYACHNHSLQTLFWMAFGSLSGYDPVKGYFHPEGQEVVHFCGNHWQNIAAWCEVIDTDLHIPEHLTELITNRKYPSIHRGRAECMGRFGGMSAEYHTETYMEEDFSLGTVSGPLCNGEQTTTCFITYKRKPEVKSFKDSATVFFRYMTSSKPIAEMEKSADGKLEGDKFIPNKSWWYSFQHRNCAVLLATPALPPHQDPIIQSDSLRLSVVFPAHFGQITASIIGDEDIKQGAVGQSKTVEPVSVETGEVFVHIQPLLPTDLPRKAAIRFGKTGLYETLDLINFEGNSCEFTRKQLSAILNGMVITVDSKSKFESLEDFHRQMSDISVRDYMMMNHRYLLFQRGETEIEVVYTPDPFGVQTTTIDGHNIRRPVFESNQIDIETLPFTTGPVPKSRPFFPWPSMNICWYPQYSSIIGSRGLPDESPYCNPVNELKD